MSLEDHAGDVVRKARQMAGTSLEAAAAAAEISVPDLESFEESGHTDKSLNFAALTRLTTLDADKLRRVAGGWTPAPVNLAQWRELRVIATRGGGLEVNAFLAWDASTCETALFDTGFDAGVVSRLVAENHLRLTGIFITHSHHDHVACLKALQRQFPEARVTSAHDLTFSRSHHPPPVHLGNLQITCRNTPGHAPDGVTYVISNWPDNAPQVAVVGDALFAGSMGGVPGRGDAARKIILDQILSLPPDTLICPGHGPPTTVAQEKANNPFFG